AIAAAARDYEQQTKIVDPRLFRHVTLQMKGSSLADFCAALQQQTGVELHAARGVADEKVTVYVKAERARDLMRAVARLFGFFWLRSGADGSFRYELDQDLKSRLMEEELRNQDMHAALLAVDEQMQRFRPYLDMSLEEMVKREGQSRDAGNLLGNITHNGGWAGMELYHRLTPSEKAALAAGEELVLLPDAADPERRLPPEWVRSILRSWGNHPEAPAGVTVRQVRLWLNRTELGQISLKVRET